LATSGNEEAMQFAFTGPAMGFNIEWLCTEFVLHIETTNQPTYLLSQQTLLGNASASFYSTWANTTSINNAPSSQWAGMLVSYKGIASGITLDQATALWDPNQNNSLLNPDTLDVWFMASASEPVNPILSNNRTANITQAQQLIQSTFNLTSSQTTMLIDWLKNSFFLTIVDPDLVSTYSAVDPGVEQISDLGWLQWASCGVTRSQSAAEIYEFIPGGIPEYGCFFLGKFDKFSVAEAKQVNF
jgi:hypothetical protein